NPAGELTCALSGNGVLTTFVQDRPYYTAFHVACLAPKGSLTTAQKLYYCACVRANRYRYGWGRQANRSLKDILLPEPEEIPDWVEGAAAVSFAGKSQPADDSPTPPLDTSAWKPFRMSSLFDLKKGKRLTKADRVPGGTPFIGALDRNNGVVGSTDQP